MSLPEATLFKNDIRDTVISHLACGSRRFQDIVRSCRGIYPTAVWSAVEEMQLQELIDTQSVNTRSRRYYESALDTIGNNPVLASWYFTQESCRYIAERSSRWNESKLAFLGTPRLYEWFRKHHIGKTRLFLETDTTVLNLLAPESTVKDTLVQYNFENDIPTDLIHTQDVVFIDPPWYLEDYFKCFVRASQLAPRGHIVLPLLLNFTRPPAGDERQLLLDFLRQYSSGLEWDMEAIDYEIPSFEARQLQAAGINSLGSWRIADLVIANLTRDILPEEIPVTTAKRAVTWEEVTVAGTRFFINVNQTSNEEDALLSLPQGEEAILTSPSRRNPVLRRLNVFTSHGHGLSTANPTQLRTVLEQIASETQAGKTINDVLAEVKTDTTTKMLIRRILNLY